MPNLIGLACDRFVLVMSLVLVVILIAAVPFVISL
jgi:hypothetical protein